MISTLTQTTVGDAAQAWLEGLGWNFIPNHSQEILV